MTRTKIQGFISSILLSGFIYFSGCSLFGGLAAPQNVNASDGTVVNRIVITWDNVIGADYYYLQRSSDNITFEYIDHDAVSPYTDTNTQGSDTNTYYYRVAAGKSNGQNRESTVSDFSESDSGYVGVAAPIQIPLDSWYVGYLAAPWDVQLYYFNSVSNNSYTFYSDHYSWGSGTYSNTIIIDAYRPGMTETYFTNGYSLYIIPITITALDSIVYLKTTCWGSGDFAIKVSNN